MPDRASSELRLLLPFALPLAHRVSFSFDWNQQEGRGTLSIPKSPTPAFPLSLGCASLGRDAVAFGTWRAALCGTAGWLGTQPPHSFS